MRHNHALFVYGTLKTGCCNHKFLKDFKAIEAKAPGIELHNGPGYPYAVRGNGTTFGELYFIDTKTLKRIDELEEHPNYYIRQKTKIIILSDYSELYAWIYLNNEGLKWPKIESGYWRC